MKFQPIISVNTAEFNKVLQECVRQSSRAAPDVINGQLLALMLRAVKWTVKANRTALAFILGQTGTTLSYTKAGKLRTARQQKRRGRLVLREDSFAARIVNARRRDYAGPDYMLWGKTLDEAAEKLIRARQKATGFIKSGWLGAIRDILPYVKFGKKSNPDAETKIAGRPKGHAMPAKQGVKRSAIVEAVGVNTALIAGGGKFQAPGAHDPLTVAQDGLRLAARETKADMERHLKEKYMEAMRKAGANVRP